jgi:Tfp pilus assembly protein FimT
MQKGSLLIQIIVTVAILSLLLVIVVGPFSNFRRNQALQNSTNTLVAMLTDARTRTLASYNSTTYGVRFDSTQATLFAGTYNSGNAANEIFTYDTPITVTTSLSGGGNMVSFDRLKGTTTNSGTITLSLPPQSRTITVSANGVITRN